MILCAIECYIFITASLPHQAKMQYLHFRFCANYFVYLGRFLKKLADNQCSHITKVSIYHIKIYTYNLLPP